MAGDGVSKWQQDKMHAAQLLSISCPGRFFLDELPSMLHYWLHISTQGENARPSDELAFALLSALGSALLPRTVDDEDVEAGASGARSETPLFAGNDVLIMQTLPSIIRRVSSIEDNTLSMQYESARRLLPAIREESRYASDISDVDQLLIPALLGSRSPLKKPHAAEVKKYILRDDDVSAIKLLSVYSIKASNTHFSARLPHSFDTDGLRRRLVEMVGTLAQSHTLYAAMKCLGCIGPAVYSGGSVQTEIRGLKRCSGKSLALLYASHVDAELEGIEVEMGGRALAP